MPLKLEILRIEEGERTVDAGAASEHKEKTFHVWVQEPKPRKFKISLAKATAGDLNVIVNNIGAVLLMDVGEMVQQNSHALYLKPDYDITVLVPAPASAIVVEPDALKPDIQVKPEPTTQPESKPESKTELEASVIPPITESLGGKQNRPPQQTR